MLPKSKQNHNESTSLSSLNSVNNMMINYNSSNLANSQSKLSTTSSGDDRYGCRSLICDSNGIIIAETAYRCMICSQTNDSIAETKEHYYKNHSNEFLLSSTNLSNSLNPSNISAHNGNLIANSILGNSLNNSLSNGLQQFSANSFQVNSNSLLSNSSNNSDALSARKRKNVDAVLEKLKNASKNRNSAGLMQSTGSLSSFLAGGNQLNSQLSSQLSSQLINSLSNQMSSQLNEEYDEDDLDDQKSDLDGEDVMMQANNSINLRNELMYSQNKNNAALLDAINKSNFYWNPLNENDNLAKDLKSKSNKLNNLFIDNNSVDNDYSNVAVNYENNIMNISNDSDNKEDLIRNMPPGVKLKRGSTTANVGKPGHVSCAVCGVVRYYSCVYRRYGQFTCQVCYRFFRTFFAKPNQYTCTKLGNCPLDVRVRCRACWIYACINLYTVDGQRKQILETYAPLNKAPDDTDSNNNSTNMNDRNAKLSSKHSLDELEGSRKKMKKANSYADPAQYSNGDDLEILEDEEDDQDEPLNMMTKKTDLSDDEELNNEEECLS